MPINDSIPPSSEPILAMVRGELSSSRRWFYRLMLLAVSVVLASLLALWVTEPGPLPGRLHFSFAAMTCIALGWVGVLTWILTRRSCPTALDRVATTWMATLACCVFLAVSVPIALFRGHTQAALWLGVTGGAMLVGALFLLRRAYSLRARLRAKLAELEGVSRSSVTSLVGIVLLVALLAWSGEASGEEGVLTRKPTTITSRKGTSVQAETGYVKVPVKHSNPEAGTIEIAFIRVPSVSDEPGPPTFILAGGPGDSGMRVVRGMFMDGGDRIRSVLHGDIIGIDQRGVGASRPNLAVPERYGFALEEPGDSKAYLAQMTETCRAVAQRVRKEGVDLSAFNTVENADDINALRRQLGYEKINLWGTSYGSHLALAILRRHENHIDRVMIASPEGPDQTLKRPAYVTNCLRRFAENDRDLLPLMARVFEQLEREPVRASAQHPMTGTPISMGISDFDIRLWTYAALSGTESSRKIPTAFQAMDEGDFTEPARWLLRYRLMAGVGSAMKHAMDAASGCSERRRIAISREAESCLLGDVVNFPDATLASAWDVPQLGDDFHRPVRSSRPVLILCGEFDPRTPVENAREIQSGLPNSKLVVIKNEAHGFRPREDVLSIVRSFFRGESLPREQWIGM